MILFDITKYFFISTYHFNKYIALYIIYLLVNCISLFIMINVIQKRLKVY